MRVLARLLAASSLALGAAVLAQPQPQPQTLAACAACHGPGGQSQIALFPSLAGQPRLFIENQLVLIREGLRDIAAMKDVMAGMGDDQIVALANYFAAQPAAVVNTAPLADKFAQGAQLSRTMLCGTCHLPGYVGQQQVPRLAGQNEPYLLLAMQQFRDKPGPGRDTIMAASLRGLSDAELDSLAHYLAHVRP